MRVGLFGGSFDPIHHGHVLPVLEVVKEHRLDRVLYLPTASPPHKDRRMAPAWLRYAMVELALLDHPQLQVSTFELGQPVGSPAGPSYTIDTIVHFQETSPDWEVFLIVGADSWAQLHTWHRVADLLARVKLIVLPRPGNVLPQLAEAGTDGADERSAISVLPSKVSPAGSATEPPSGEPLAEPLAAALARGDVVFSGAAPVAASSTRARSEIAAGSAEVERSVDQRVLELIRKYRLYS